VIPPCVIKVYGRPGTARSEKTGTANAG
jgi:hypothetical protein